MTPRQPTEIENRDSGTIDMGYHYLLLLTMKECSGKKVLIVKVSQNDLLDPSSQKYWPGEQ